MNTKIVVAVLKKTKEASVVVVVRNCNFMLEFVRYWFKRLYIQGYYDALRDQNFSIEEAYQLTLKQYEKNNP